MPKAPPRLDPDHPVHRFALEMRSLRLRAGDPALRELARAMSCSHSTVSAYLNGHRLPPPRQLKAFVLACKGDPVAWQLQLEAVRQGLSRRLPAPDKRGATKTSEPQGGTTEAPEPHPNSGLPSPSASHLSPEERDTLRSDRNDQLRGALQHETGVTDSGILQLEDHSDKGYILHVTFDREKTSAAEVLSKIRATFERLFPDVPYFGQKLTERDDSVGFGFTYLDHNALFPD
jgi:transcriptional regulator with XRE-family HTH domain